MCTPAVSTLRPRHLDAVSTGQHLHCSKQQVQQVTPNDKVAINAAAVWTESLPFVRLSRQHNALQAKEHERQLVLGRRQELAATRCVLNSQNGVQLV
jgi:hypothetical protein